MEFLITQKLLGRVEFISFEYEKEIFSGDNREEYSAENRLFWDWDFKLNSGFHSFSSSSLYEINIIYLKRVSPYLVFIGKVA